MADETFVYDLLRRDDLLSLRFGFVNLQLTPTQHLERIVPGQPAFMIVHLPPQAIAEEAFFINAANQGSVKPPPVRTMLANESRLVFRIPSDVQQLPYTLETLLNWQHQVPSLAPNALPAEATTGPAPAPLKLTETALEFPHRLILSPDSTSYWLHSVQAVTHGQYTELWHTRLGVHIPQPNGTVREDDMYRDVRAVGRYDIQNQFTSSLSQSERQQITRLSSDFSLGPRLKLAPTALDLDQLILRWRRFENKRIQLGLPSKYSPKPIQAERLMLTPLGASVRLSSQWDYPTLPPDEELDPIVMERFSLEQYQHIAGLGRDQYVKTVKKAFFHQGHRTSLIKVTERIFSPEQVRRDENGAAVFGAIAYLRQYFQVVVQQPEVDYAELHPGYANLGREMLFRSICLTTLVTPRIDLPFDLSAIEARVRARFAEGTPEYNAALQDAIDAAWNEPFWVRVLGKDFMFRAIGTDVDGNQIHFELPMLLIPLKSANNNGFIFNRYHEGPASRRTILLTNQSVAYAPSGERPGSTHLKTQSLTFDLEMPVGTPGVTKHLNPAQLPTHYPVRFLPYVLESNASVPAVEHLLGSSHALTLRLDARYLDHALASDSNPGQTFVQLVNPLQLNFPADKAGGLARPNMGVQALSRTLGPVASPDQLAARKIDTSVFKNARLLGGIAISDILGAAAFEPTEVAFPEISEAQLEDPGFRIKAPILQTRRLTDANEGLTAIEVRYVWKPVLKSHSAGPFRLDLPPNADLLLDARLLRQTGAPNAEGTFVISGRLRNFSLSFAGAVIVNIRELYFRSETGKKMDVGAKDVQLSFDGPLKFVDTLRNILPTDGFDDPPYVRVDTEGILAGYTLAVPTVGVGIFSLQNLSLAAALSVPFGDKPAGVRFAISERHHPFIVAVTLFGGGGFFALAVSAKGIEELEAAIEFGGNISLNLGVASGGVYVMAGIYFKMTGSSVTLTGYLRLGGNLCVLGIISISIEFYLAFTYRSHGRGGEVWGQASVKVSIKIAFFSMSISLSIERRFAGAAGDPTFAETVSSDQWQDYLLAFA